MKLRFRIIETHKGYICEYLYKKTLFGKVWRPFLTYSGSTEAYYFSTYTGCADAFKKENLMNLEE